MAKTQEETENMNNMETTGQNDTDTAVEASGSTSIDSAEVKFPEMEYSSEGTVFSPLDPKLELLYDLQLPISIELGRTNMLIRDIIRLGRGSVVEFDKLVSEPVDVLINGKKVAEGEVVVIDKHFGIRITTLIDPTDRMRAIKR